MLYARKGAGTTLNIYTSSAVVCVIVEIETYLNGVYSHVPAFNVKNEYFSSMIAS